MRYFLGAVRNSKLIGIQLECLPVSRENCVEFLTTAIKDIYGVQAMIVHKLQRTHFELHRVMVVKNALWSGITRCRQ